MNNLFPLSFPPFSSSFEQHIEMKGPKRRARRAVVVKYRLVTTTTRRARRENHSFSEDEGKHPQGIRRATVPACLFRGDVPEVSETATNQDVVWG